MIVTLIDRGGVAGQRLHDNGASFVHIGDHCIGEL
jgi:hypothetical protein